MKKKDIVEMQLRNELRAIRDNEENTRINNQRLQAEKERNRLEERKLLFEMKTKDRVDISLNEYNKMKDEITRLKQENSTYKGALNGIGVTDFEFKSIEKTVVDDPARMEYHLNIRLTYDKKIK